MPQTSKRRRHDREIAALAIPALGALVAEPLYILADTAVVGRIGTEELAGLAVASAALLTGMAVLIFLAYGTTAAVSRLLGAGRDDEAASQAVQGLWLAGIIGVVLGAVVAAFPGPIVGVLGAEGEVRTQAEIYLQISAVGIPFQLLTFAGVGYLRGLQNTRTPLAVAIAAATTNLVLELVLVLGLDFGIAASAWSTVVAQTGAAGVYLWMIARDAHARSVRLGPDPVMLRRLSRVGGDLFVRTVALRGTLTVATAVAARLGTVEVAAHEIALAVWSLGAFVLDAIAIAGQAMIGRFLGAGDERSARDVGRRMLELGFGFGVVAGAVVLIARPWLPGVFTGDDAVVSLAGFLLIWVGAMQPVNAVAFVLDGLLIGAGDMAFLARAMVAAAAVALPIAAAVVVFDLGIGWLWGSIAALMVARVVALSWRWQQGAWSVTGA